ncbi:uncharacterized protein LOC127251000 [Andrographis paniculata]|uniref:uncharacterized protein LOC127251000 n=1 Tax=Andrographis paniculata TaxID=175694 RepID=UPI0021E8F546|nr:uncharacterized protein LOC127251000 [Andrographis paniculata]
MARRNPSLLEMLQEDQEPFQLKTYIADRRSQIKKPSPSQRTAVQLRNRKPAVVIADGSRNRGGILCRHACFFAFQNSPDLRKSPFADWPASPAKSPTRAAAFLHIPSRTAALLLEAALRVQKPRPGSPGRTPGFGPFGSFLRRLRDRSKNKKRAISDNDFTKNAAKSCSHRDRRISSPEWTSENEIKSMAFEASTSSYSSDWSEQNFRPPEKRFCVSPFQFSFHPSPSPTGRRTPEFSSPAGSPRRHVSKKESNEEDEDKEDQSSPVSVLEPVFDEDDDDCEIECSSYANVQRAKEQFLLRLRRFEKLADIGPMELDDEKLLDESGEDDFPEDSESVDKKPLSVDLLVSRVLDQSDIQTAPSPGMTKLVGDLIVEEKGERMCRSGEAAAAVVGRIRERLDLWKEVELDTIDMMVGLDMRGKKGADGWTKFAGEIEEAAAEVEAAVCGVVVDELLEELCYMESLV